MVKLNTMGEKILYIPHTGSHAIAHVARIREIADSLREAGVDGVFALDPRYPFQDLIKERGYEIIPLEDVDLLPSLRLGNLDLLTGGLVNDRVTHALEIIRMVNPDLVMTDTHWFANTAAKIDGVPTVAMTNASICRFNTRPISAPERHPVTRLIGQKLADLAAPLL